MAAIDTDFMTDSQADVSGVDGAVDGTAIAAVGSTYAAFSPDQTTATHRRAQSSMLIHQKSPLLLATPPQVTRALAYSHPFLLPLNHLVGLLSWTTDDVWESFLLLATFWFLVLYGDIINRFAGPLVLVTGLIFALYARRFSPLSRASVEKKKKAVDKAITKGKPVEDNDSSKSLDAILDTLQTFTNRCSVLFDPFLSMTEFLSTQTTATASTTRPALFSLFIRILLISPVWTILSLPPLYIITTQRVVLVLGTFILSFHSTPARVTRALLWRSRLVRNLASVVSGLNFATPAQVSSLRSISARSLAKTKQQSHENVRFTFTIYENQRRWLGLGWTTSLLAYERQAWTDSQLNPVAEPDSFVLPETDQEGTEWRWVEDSDWRVETFGSHDDSKARDDDDEGWFYFDSSWNEGRATDGWGRYTRRRCWVRDAELVDLAQEAAEKAGETADAESATRPAPVSQRRSWFARRRTSNLQKVADKVDSITSGASTVAARLREAADEDVLTPLRFRNREFDRDVGEGVVEGLG